MVPTETVQAIYHCGHRFSESCWENKHDVPKKCQECGNDLKQVDVVGYDVNIYNGSVSEVERKTHNI